MRIALSTGARVFVDVDGALLRPRGPSLCSVPQIVFVHGGPGFDHSGFREPLAPMAADAQLIYFDQRGMGRSERSVPANWNLERWSADLLALIDDLGLDSPVVVGQSFGGFVAIQAASAAGDRFGGLLLSSTAARHVPADCVSAFAALAGSDAAAAADAFFETPSIPTYERYVEACFPAYNPTPQSAEVAARQIVRREVLLHFWRDEFRRFDLRSALGSISCPVAVVNGGLDPITPPARSLEIVAALPPSVLVDHWYVPNAGHGVFRDQPEPFRSWLRAFLAEVVGTDGLLAS